jgi:hypothetical protein
MWAQIKVRLKVNAQPRTLWFPRMEKLDTSLYLLGWGGAVTDAETTLTPVMRFPAPNGVGLYNWGRVKNERFEELAIASGLEADPRNAKTLVKAALREYQTQVHLIPLHRQMIPWATRSHVDVVHRPDNWLELPWVTCAEVRAQVRARASARGQALHRFQVGLAVGRQAAALAGPHHLAQAFHHLVVGPVQRLAPFAARRCPRQRGCRWADRWPSARGWTGACSGARRGWCGLLPPCRRRPAPRLRRPGRRGIRGVR